MQNDLVFRAGWVKRALGWAVGLGSAAALAAMIYGVLTHPTAQVPAELGSAAVIGVFLLGLILAGISLQYAHWRIEGDEIVHRGLFRKKTIPVAQLAGFGRTIIVVNLIPLVQIDLYDAALKPVTRLPVGAKDWPRAEAWLAARLRYVVNDGSPALPRYRFAEPSKD